MKKKDIFKSNGNIVLLNSDIVFKLIPIATERSLKFFLLYKINENKIYTILLVILL